MDSCHHWQSTIHRWARRAVLRPTHWGTSTAYRLFNRRGLNCFHVLSRVSRERRIPTRRLRALPSRFSHRCIRPPPSHFALLRQFFHPTFFFSFRHRPRFPHFTPPTTSPHFTLPHVTPHITSLHLTPPHPPPHPPSTLLSCADRLTPLLVFPPLSRPLH